MQQWVSTCSADRNNPKVVFKLINLRADGVARSWIVSRSYWL